MGAKEPLSQHYNRDMLPVALRVFIFLYVIFSCSHYLLLPKPVALPMTLLAASAVIIGLVIQSMINRPIIQDHGETVIMVLLLLMALNSGAHFYATLDIKQTTNFIFVAAISGYLLFTPFKFFITLALLFVSWPALVLLGPGWSTEAMHFSFAMGMGGMLAIFLHTVRRSQLAQMQELESTVERLTESEQAISAGQSLIQSLMDNMQVAVIVADEQNRLLYGNAAAREMTNAAGTMLEGQTVPDIFEVCDADGNPLADDRRPSLRVLESGDAVTNELISIRLRDGSLRYGLYNGRIIAADATAGRRLLVSFLDITSRIQTEAQLQESEERAVAIINAVQDGIVTVDGEHKVTLINPAAQLMTGFSESDALGQKLDKVVAFRAYEPGRGVDTQSGDADVRQGLLQSRQGTELPIELTTSTVPGQTGNIGEVLTMRDLRDQRMIEQERATFDKMRSVGLLAGGIAHDFNNLLTAIYGNLNMAEMLIDERDQALAYIKRSTDSIHHATNLTNQLLTFATGSEPVLEVVDAEKLVREATRFVLSGSSVAVTYDIDPALRLIEVDAGQVQQAVNNIILNAVQAMGDGGQIRIGLHNVGDGDTDVDWVEIVIADNGPGIASEIQARMFEPYFTTKETGSGLGLATTHSIITKHGGNLTVESSPGEGTTFRLTLPASQSAPVETSQRREEPAGAAAALRILVMDDEDIVRKTLVDLLQALGHEAAGSVDGDDALKQYALAMEAGKGFHLVIMDFTVAGGMGGKEAAEKILAIDPTARLIVSSGYSAGSELARYQELGFAARLEKPFTLSKLESVVLQVAS